MKSFRQLLMMCFIMLATTLFSQDYQWLDNYGGSSDDVILGIASDGQNYFVTGKIQSSGTISYGTFTLEPGAFVAAHNREGDVLWAVNVILLEEEDPFTNSSGNAIDYYEGHVYVTGYFIPSGTSKKLFVTNYDAVTGTKVYEDTENNTTGNGIVVNEHGVFIAGAVTANTTYATGVSVSATHTEALYIKLDLGLVPEFASASNGDIEAQALSIATTGNNFYYLCGDYGGASDEDNGLSIGGLDISTHGKDLFILAYYDTEDPLASWLISAGNPNTDKSDFAYNIVAEASGDVESIYLTGRKPSGTAIYDGINVSGAGTFIARYDFDISESEVNAVWAERLEYANGYGLTLFENDVLVIGDGFFGRLEKSDGDPSSVWASPGLFEIGGDAIGYCINACDCGTIIFGGTSATDDEDYCGGDTENCISIENVGGRDIIIGSINPLLGKLSLALNFVETETVDAVTHGFNLVNTFVSCRGIPYPDPANENELLNEWDPLCYTSVVDFLPKVVRFPSAGDAKIFNTNLGSPGYGMVDINAVVETINYSYKSKLRSPAKEDFEDGTLSEYVYSGPGPNDFEGSLDMSSHFCPLECNDPTNCMESEDEPCEDPSDYFDALYILHEDCFSDHEDYDEYIIEINELACQWYAEQVGCAAESYLESLIKIAREVNETVADTDMGVIYTANIFTATSDEVITTIKQLINFYDEGLEENAQDGFIDTEEQFEVNVVAIELGNEVWGMKANKPYFGDATDDRFLNYWYWITGDATNYENPTEIGIEPIYKYVQELRDFIDENGLNIDLLLPVTHPHIDYLGCDEILGDPNDAAWITSMITNEEMWSDLIDGYAIHPYFGDKFWLDLSTTEEGNECDVIVTTSTEIGEGIVGANDSELQPLFEKFLENSMLFTDINDVDFEDDGFVEAIMGEFNLALFEPIENKPFYITEWNLLESNESKKTKIFHNTFMHGILLFNWEMAMHQANLGLEDPLIKYATLYNGVGQNENMGTSPIKINGENCVSPEGEDGEGELIEAAYLDPEECSNLVRRIPYYTQTITREIDLLDLKWVPLEFPQPANAPNLRLYAFTENTPSTIYLYFANPDETDIVIDTRYICLDGLSDVIDIENCYVEGFNVDYLYSTAGYNQIYKESGTDYYGPDWNETLPNEVNQETYQNFPGETIVEELDAYNIMINPYSIGVIKFPLEDAPERLEDLEELFEMAGNNMKVFPNPTNNELNIDIQLNSESIDPVIVILYDLVGKIVCRSETTINGIHFYDSLSLGNLVPAGIYLLKVKIGDIEFTQQVAVQK